jgi:hypothetical protein
MKIPGTPSTTYTSCQNRVSTPASGPGQPQQAQTVWGTDCQSKTYPGQPETQQTLVTSYYFVAGRLGGRLVQLECIEKWRWNRCGLPLTLNADYDVEVKGKDVWFLSAADGKRLAKFKIIN